MKAHIVYDKDGKVISAAFLPPTFDLMSPDFGPMPDEDQHAAVLDVPEEELSTVKFVDLAQRLRVDIKARKLTIEGK